MVSAQGEQLTSLTKTSLCPLAACWLSLSWLCSFTTSCVALRRWSSTTSSSASSRFTLCSNSRDRSRGIPPLESVNDWILLLSSRFSSWSLATWEKRRQTNKGKKDQKLKHTIVPRLRLRHKKKLDHYALYKDKLQKLQISQNEILRLVILPCFVSSCDVWNLFSRAPIRNCLWCYYRKQITPIALEKCNKIMWHGLKYSGTMVQGFCPLKIKIT